MKPPDPEVVRAWLERSCAAQSIPVKIADPRIIAKVVTLLGQASRQSASMRSGSKVARPRTAGRTIARSSTAETIER